MAKAWWIVLMKEYAARWTYVKTDMKKVGTNGFS